MTAVHTVPLATMTRVIACLGVLERIAGGECPTDAAESVRRDVAVELGRGGPDSAITAEELQGFVAVTIRDLRAQMGFTTKEEGFDA